jgi:hypothetical protein
MTFKLSVGLHENLGQMILNLSMGLYENLRNTLGTG